MLDFARIQKIPLLIIGAGSNILVDDRGIKGIVAKLNSPCFKRILVNKRVISAGAGLSLSRLVRCAKENGLSGFELLAGIPGTVGGALIMNAGNIGDNVYDMTIMDKRGRLRILKRKDIHFNYRDSNLSDYIILNAQFKLVRKNKKSIAKSINDYLDYRRKTQDLSWPSAGCIFRNPDSKSVLRFRSGAISNKIKPSAAYFIERAGLKGSSIGGAAVSLKHANFIINKGKASSWDILRLMTYITRRVKRRFNLDLKPEIKIWR